MPRIGFAYQASSRFVVRGIANDLEGTGTNLRLALNPPFQSSFEANGTAPSASGPGESFAVEDGFTSTGGSQNLSGTTYRAWDSHLKPSFIGEYSLKTDYQLTNSMAFQVGYVGESGQHRIPGSGAEPAAHPLRDRRCHPEQP